SIGFALVEEGAPGSSPPVGELRRLTINLPAGLVLDPQAPAQCTVREFEGLPEHECPHGSEVGTDKLTLYPSGVQHTVTASLYDLAQGEGLASEFGVYIPQSGGLQAQHLLLEGHISASDYHEYLE